MTDIFASAKSVLRRANHHITNLEFAVKVITPDQPYSYVLDQDAKTGEYFHKLIRSQDFSGNISCIMFDAVNNLRACLDQMTFAIAVKHRGGDKFAPFPFSSDADHWPNKINGLKHDLPAQIRMLFERFKPYKGGNNTLWALNYLANVKKHALLVPAGYLGISVRIPAGTDVPPVDVTPSPSGDKDEIIIYRSFEPVNRHPNIEVTYRIVIDHPEGVIQGQPPVPLLNAMSGEVERVMIDTEAECRRIALIDC
jgi:hypothetical protein